jgi:threonine/homoserine/homoserine lactone efflux protein
MNDPIFFIKGFILGFCIAAPVGPIGILCIGRTLSNGRLSGFISGVGAAFADALYGGIAAFGLTALSDFLLSIQIWLRVCGGIFLFYLGIKTFLTTPSREKNANSYKLTQDLISTFLLTMTNPMTIFSFLIVFAAMGIGEKRGDYADAGSLVLGVFLGSSLWWLTLSEGITFFRKRIDQKLLKRINQIAGLLISAFGIFALLSPLI